MALVIFIGAYLIDTGSCRSRRAIDHALEIHEVRDAVIPGTISMALEMGQNAREALAKDQDVASAVAKIGAGFVAFRGVVAANDWKTEDGFTIGNVSIAGIDEFRNDEYRIWLKNENMVV